LRSFEDEAEEMTVRRSLLQSFTGRLVGGGEASYGFEQDDFAGYLNWVGPYITLARPGERRIHGAARKTVSNDEWKTVVSDFIQRSAFIVLRAGTSPGLRWEMEQIVKQFAPTRLLLITPGRRADYEAFRSWAAAVLPMAMPERLPRSRLVAFDRAWNPYALKPRANFIDTISPFFRQQGIDFPASAIDAYVRQQRTGHPMGTSRKSEKGRGD